VIDHLVRKTLNLSLVRTLVLDEADRMLDMGFQEDMERILSQVPATRQTIFFSATFPHTIEQMSRLYQKDAVRVTIERKEQQIAPIRQVAYEVEAEDKLKALLWVLQQVKPESAIVFCNLKAHAAELTEELMHAGVSAAAIHGDLEQNERDRVMAKFRNHSVRLLIATDVAARGIDIEALDAVVNFDMPAKPDIYVHRIGRTGRAGKKGLAVSLVLPKEKAKLDAIFKATGQAVQMKQVASLEHLDERKLQADFGGEAAMETLFIGAGRKDKMRPGDILGALTGDAGGMKGADIGKIEIHDRFSYVAISRDKAALVLQRLREGKIKGRKVRVERVR
jgi:ATP-independent RNA helicase DbpA